MEGTFSRAVGWLGARGARYRGWLEKARSEHVPTAVALNVLRATECLRITGQGSGRDVAAIEATRSDI